ncbi:MAG TPA: carboxylesterase family protein [Bryobacteraceae bacterium]|nr:carboxylesterase family protein [Bryobacteraceae bacterium]
MKRLPLTVSLCFLAAAAAFGADRVKTANGVLESNTSKDGVRMFRGIPFAAPPVGDLRWKAPQPVKNWSGVRKADEWGARCMQRAGGDYWFRSSGPSEDCLYLNVWTPAKSANEKLPVLVYIFGGGFQNGGGSEYRYDGESMARKGIVAVTLNYRLGIFGFFSHPELTKESPHHASGNYGLLDQVAALEWVQKNIAAFGGDPKHVTVAGESAGSISVSALMASPLSKNLMAGAIGESGALIATLPPKPLAETEKTGVAFAEKAGATSLEELRALSADKIMELTAPAGRGGGRGAGPALSFSVNLDGYFLPKTLPEIFEAGQQAKIPMLAGSNSAEQGPNSVLGQGEPTVENFKAAIERLYPGHADEVLKVYAPTTPEEARQAATDLASARFIAFGTWKWTELQAEYGGKPVYRYYYARVRPRYTGMPGEAPVANAGTGSGAGRGGGRGGAPMTPAGAAHSSEIQYAMGNLDLDPRYEWDADDHRVSETMQAYFANFIKTFNPNGAGLPEWPAYNAKTGYQRMRIDVESKAGPEPDRARYAVLEKINDEQK